MATDDDGMTFSNLLYGASPCRGGDDESSVDIYDGLDSTPIASITPATKVTPTRSSLNLFDEILIEETTAKEATYNDLQSEHKKSQQQLQELMKKLQEIEEQNSTLQKENQCLKKNISALIKTARVEINRKDEEISNLQRRLSDGPVHQNTYSRTYFSASTNKTRNFEGSKAKNKCRDLLSENNPKMDPQTKNTLSKDIPPNYPSQDLENKKFHSGKRDIPYIPRSHPEQLNNDGAHSRLTNVDSSCDKEKGKNEIKHNEYHSRENDCKYKTKVQQNLDSTADRILDSHGKLKSYPEKTVKNGHWKDSKDLKLKSSSCAEKRTSKVPAAKEKQPSPKDILLSKTGHSSDDRSEKSQNINRKDLKIQNKDESNSGQKARQPDRCLEQQRTGKLSSPTERNTISRSFQKLNKSYVEVRKVKDSDCRRNKGADYHGLQGGRLSPPLPPISNKEQKHSYSKEDNSKCEQKHSKSDRHRTEEKRKNERHNPRENRNSQNERRDSKEKTTKGTIKIKGGTKREEKKSFRPEEIAKIVDGVEEQMPTKAGRDEEQSKSKDLKLSFMQKLNLTLSPAKKQTDRLKSVAKSANDCNTEIPSQEVTLVPDEPSNNNPIKQTETPLLHIHGNPIQTNLKKITAVSEIKVKVVNEGLAETMNIDPSKTTSFPRTKEKHELADNVKLLSEAETEMEEVDGIYIAPGLGSPINQDTLPDNSFSETICSVDFDSFSVIDEINGTDSDSLVDEEESSKCAEEKVLEYPEKENKPVPHKTIVEKSKILSGDVTTNDQKAHNLKPSFPDTRNHLETLCSKESNPTFLAGDTNPISVDDDNSILSIDLNHMRHIPKAISPINSPIRPLAKVLRMESPFKGSVKSYITDFVPDNVVVYPGRNQSNELNKENQKPLCTDHQIVVEPQLNMSSDELEEGEIISDNDEPILERNSENSKKTKRKVSPDRSNLSKSTCNLKVKTTPSSEDTEKSASGKKSKEKPKDGTIISSSEVKKNKAVSIDCLEKIVKITAEPSTAHEFMQMLRAIRKQIRKNYMKFKIQFPVQNFHRIIESAVLNFTSLVKYLDFSKMSKLSEALKLNLCEVIESKLNQIKRNSEIEHLFEHQQSDMKKKLWKLVDVQLDYLFDKIKKILLKFCNLISSRNENDEGKLDKRTKKSPKCLVNHKTERQKSKKTALNARTQKPEECAPRKPVVGNQLSKRDHHDTRKMDTHKNIASKCKGSYANISKHSQIKAELFKEKSIKDSTLKVGKYEKEGSYMAGDPPKSDISCGPLTEQQMSGLTFNLVNDAQMGEMFKSLLQGSDLSEKNDDFIDENQWEFRTPEKHMPDGQICGNESAYETEGLIPKETQVESRVLDGIKWPVVSPERDSAFLTRLQMPIDPDILDESCMFEIPNSPALKKNEICISEKPKSVVSSILLEDLAVSLTIPSPLKSDAHLSFLKPDILGSVPEDVLSAHFSEDAHLEEEDASEQDIHLALESDNSSSNSTCSSSWASMPAAPGFQYCPSLPMQAVIMEKSNDHFIVKIRRAAPSTSRILDQAILGNEHPTTLTERRNNEIMTEEKLDTLNSKCVPLEETAMCKEKMNNNYFRDEMHDHNRDEQVLNSLECVEESSVCLEKDQVPTISEPQQEPHPGPPDDVFESVEGLFTHASQEQKCNMTELQDPYSSTTQIQGSDQVSHSSVSPEEVCDLHNPPKEVGISLACPKESSNDETAQSEDTPEVFKLPQTHTVKAFQISDVSCGKIEQSPVHSAEIPFVKELSSKSHFNICIDLTDDSPMENEIDSWDLTVESALNTRMGCLYKNKETHKSEDRYAASDPLEHDVEGVINLTEDLLDKPAVNENFQTKAVLNIDDQKSQMSLNKESRKRKKEMEETSSAKRQRKESNELGFKKPCKNGKKSKETTSASISASIKKAAVITDKDPLPSTSSMSPSSLRAKNIIKKKGEVVISWTRNDDREILLECQKKGPSGKTFASVASRLNKNPTQIEERFKQLVKLFKMSNCS
ncbi:CASP8-associated protein 2 [Elgaria multicarinata webbii]|uniref:CASP8-associated protein 2 n=1 Tax=Elgaria multicarinata webbii TaxID=159646 RepID=UPI002FCCFDA4